MTTAPVASRARSRKTPVPPATEVIGTVRPLGTAARAAAARVYNPTLSETDATIVALATELVTMKGEMTKLAEKVGKLERAVSALLMRSLKQEPPVAKIEAPVATQQRMNPERENRVRRMNGLSNLPTAKQAPARRAPKAEPLPYLGNARLIKVFDTFIKTGKHFNRDHDANLAVPSSKWLLDAAADYLDTYEGTDQYLVNVGQYETRSVPQLRGVLGKMLTFYKSHLARG
jgi:hypothetical protein